MSLSLASFVVLCYVCVGVSECAMPHVSLVGVLGNAGPTSARLADPFRRETNEISRVGKHYVLVGDRIFCDCTISFFSFLFSTTDSLLSFHSLPAGAFSWCSGNRL